MPTATQARLAIAARSSESSELDDGCGFTEARHKAELAKFDMIDARMTNAQVVRATEYIRALRRARLA
jgi:hypothetical protein